VKEVSSVFSGHPFRICEPYNQEKPDRQRYAKVLALTLLYKLVWNSCGSYLTENFATVLMGFNNTPSIFRYIYRSGSLPKGYPPSKVSCFFSMEKRPEGLFSYNFLMVQNGYGPVPPRTFHFAENHFAEGR